MKTTNHSPLEGGAGGCFDSITKSYIPLSPPQGGIKGGVTPPSRGKFKGFFRELWTLK